MRLENFQLTHFRRFKKNFRRDRDNRGCFPLPDNLAAQERHRTVETIQIFNLNGSLRQIRKPYVMGYQQTAEHFLTLADEFDEDEWRPLQEQEPEAIADQAFETAIHHVLQID